MKTYTIRHNYQHRGHILVSCCFGHPIEDVHTGRGFGAGAAESRIASHSHKCRDCERAGLAKSSPGAA